MVPIAKSPRSVMLELPEVEIIVADLRPHLLGRTIVRCELSFPTIVQHPEPEEFVDEVVGMRIKAVGRRGKYILIALGTSNTGPSGGAPPAASPPPPHEWGGADLMLVLHLALTGHLRVVDAVAPLGNHTHPVLVLDHARQRA